MEKYLSKDKTYLNLSWKKLKILPNFFDVDLSNLEKFSLHTNQIKVLPKSWSKNSNAVPTETTGKPVVSGKLNLSNLKYFNLSYNHIKKLPQSWSKNSNVVSGKLNLSKLEYFYLSNNKIKKI